MLHLTYAGIITSLYLRHCWHRPQLHLTYAGIITSWAIVNRCRPAGVAPYLCRDYYFSNLL